MLKKFWKFKKNIICFFLCVLLLVPFSFVRADSGWDSSYDSGGGSSWSSSSSDWGSSSSSSSSSSHYDMTEGETIVFLISVILCMIGMAVLLSQYSKYFSKSTSFEEVSEEEFKKYFPMETMESLKEQLFQKFVAIQDAWMNFEYDKLRELCTDELYNSYKTQLETLALKNGQNIMSDYVLKKSVICKIEKEGSLVSVQVYMLVSFYDYVIDTKTKKVTRGTKDSKITNHYVMTFVRSDEKKEVKCPNCGAVVPYNTSGVCKYCRATIVKDADEFVLSKKTNVNK